MQVRGRGILLCILLCMVMFLGSNVVMASGSNPVTTGSTEKTPLKGGDLSVTVKEILGGKVKGTSTTGLTITITNTGKDFEGTVRVLQTNQSGEGYQSTEKEILIPAGESKTVILPCIPFERDVRFDLQIKDSSGDKVINNKLTATFDSTTNVMIGVLSEDASELNYFSNSFTTVFQMDEKTLPTNAQVLGGIDIIVLNNFDTSKLSAVQYDTLKEWVKLGGTLVIGTGDSYTKTLSLFKDDFIAGTYQSLSTVNTSFGLKASEVSQITNLDFSGIGTYLDFGKISASAYMPEVQSEEELINNTEVVEQPTNTTPLPTVKKEWLDIAIDGSFQCILEGDKAILQRKEYGKGVVEVFNVDLTLDNTLWKTLGNQITRAVLSCMGDESKNESMMYMNGNAGVYTMDSLTTGDITNIPKTSLFFIILVVYLIICGPVLYIVFKKIGKRDYLWGAVPVTALIFTFIITSVGGGNKFRDATINYVQFITMTDSKYVVDNVQLSVMSPSNKDYSIALRNEFEGQNIESPFYHYSDNSETAQPERNIYLGETDTLKVKDPTTFGNYEFNATRIREQEETYSSTLTLDDSKTLTGTFENKTGYQFSNCAILSYAKISVLGALKSGETADASKAYTSNLYQDLYSNDGIDRLIGGSYDSQDHAQRIQFEAIQKLYYSYCAQFTNSSEQIFVGIVEGIDDTSFSEAVDIGSTGYSLVIIPLNIPTNSNISKMSSLENINEIACGYTATPFNGKEMGITTGNWYGADSKEYICKYQLNAQLANGVFSMQSVDEAMKYGYDVSTEFYFYNFTTKQYDLKSSSMDQGYRLESDYLNKSNQLIIKYLSPAQSDGYQYALPIISVKGDVQ